MRKKRGRDKKVKVILEKEEMPLNALNPNKA